MENGQLVIKQEGKGKKYVKKVEQVTFSGAYAAATKQPVLFVTERAVFELQDGQVTLIEIAPGINLEKDILAQMEFTPADLSQSETNARGDFPAKPGEGFARSSRQRAAKFLGPRRRDTTSR